MSILNYLLENLNKYDFERGDCNVYALALNSKYDLPIYAAVGYFNDDGVTGTVVSHVFVKTDDGKFKDSSGEYTEAEMKQKSNTDYFTKVKIIPMTPDEAVSVFCDEPVDGFDDLMVGDAFDDIYDFDDFVDTPAGNAACEDEVKSKVNDVIKHI